MSDPLRRRAALAALIALPGCGFRAQYAAPSQVGEPDLVNELSAVRIGYVAERNGQIMRQALARRIRPGSGVAAKYELRVVVLPGLDVQGFRRDGTPTRIRQTIDAPWSLVTLSVPPVTLVEGTARAFDASNIPDNEFFAGIVSSEASQRRALEQIAADILERVAIRLREPRAT